MLTATIGRLAAGEDLTFDEAQGAVEAILDGVASDQEIALFLSGLRMKGETAAEIAGTAAALRQNMSPIRSSRPGLLDTCGTGGDGSSTFNISTAAALVTAAAGVPVAKHGNRRFTSRSGSADVLAELGVNVEASIATVERCLDELGICFCFAPLFHGSMRRVAEVRRQMAVPTIFNLVGPLSNPASAPFQLLGVGRADLRERIAEALAMLGTEHALVVHGRDGLDEVTLGEQTDVIEIRRGAPPRSFTWQPADFGLEQQPLDTLAVEGPTDSAATIRRILAGDPGPARDIVLLNAGAALWLAGRAPTPLEGATLAAAAIDTGAAQDLLARLVERSRP
ncbi:MAG: anthranilate phosphoribosyltransferase [Pirellulales bacterium]|nr:anthranilate phosphoribosyltransferase [Pirellulales bacterium]